MKLTFIEKILSFVSKAFRDIKNALSKGEAIANEIKAVADSPILDVVVKLTPTNIDDKGLEYLRKGLTAFIIAMGWAKKAVNDFDGDQDARAVVLTALNAKASVLVADINGAKLSIQQALASAPVVYNPDIVKV